MWIRSINGKLIEINRTNYSSCVEYYVDLSNTIINKNIIAKATPKPPLRTKGFRISIFYYTRGDTVISMSGGLSGLDGLSGPQSLQHSHSIMPHIQHNTHNVIIPITMVVVFIVIVSIIVFN